MIKQVTEIPGPRSRELMARRQQAVPRGLYNTAPIFIRHAEGATLEDVDGNTYIDFAAGIGCLNVGSTPPEVVAAIKDQADDFLHTCFFSDFCTYQIIVYWIAHFKAFSEANVMIRLKN